MPKIAKGDSVRRSELPGTLRRSGPKAQRTFAKAHDAAAEQYGEGRRAHQTAYSAVKHSYEKVGDHWERKGGGRRGPSDEQAKGGRDTNRPTKGGVDAEAPKSELYDIAKRLGIGGRSRMSKGELVNAIQKANNKKTREARS